VGYYINQTQAGPLDPHGKADRLINDEGAAELVGAPGQLSHVQKDQAIVCVVDNGLFEAAGLAYSQEELEAFASSGDLRPKRWLKIDKKRAHELTNLPERLR
jgi:hypothetical protein